MRGGHRPVGLGRRARPAARGAKDATAAAVAAILDGLVPAARSEPERVDQTVARLKDVVRQGFGRLARQATEANFPSLSAAQRYEVLLCQPDETRTAADRDRLGPGGRQGGPARRGPRARRGRPWRRVALG